MGRRFWVVAALVIAMMPIGPPALADDNDTPFHWHARRVTYRMSDTLPATWFDQVRFAAEEWTNRSRLRFDRGANIAGAPFGDAGSRIVWRGTIPAAWQAGCPPATTLACARTVAGAQDHLVDADFLFNENQSMGHNSFNCHVFGVFTRDVRSIALHEFGHWGHLAHTNDRAAVMFGTYVTCRRQLHQHDIDSMLVQYQGH